MLEESGAQVRVWLSHDRLADTLWQDSEPSSAGLCVALLRVTVTAYDGHSQSGKFIGVLATHRRTESSSLAASSSATTNSYRTAGSNCRERGGPRQDCGVVGPVTSHSGALWPAGRTRGRFIAVAARTLYSHPLSPCDPAPEEHMKRSAERIAVDQNSHCD